jgi:hypothetical protein
LANVCLHYFLDTWIVWWRKHRCRGDVVIVRHADDFAAGNGGPYRDLTVAQPLPHRQNRRKQAVRSGGKPNLVGCVGPVRATMHSPERCLAES